MAVIHLSDNEIQQYLDNNKNDESITEHLSFCESCRTLLNQYQSLFETIESEKIVLNEDFSINTMNLIRRMDTAESYSYRNIVLIGIVGIVISLLSMVYIIGYEVILQPFKNIHLNEMFAYKETAQSIFDRYGSILKIAFSGSIILLFFTKLDNLLSRLKASRLSIFSL